MTKEIMGIIHGSFGTIVLLTGLLQILLKKGGKLHQTIGKIYLYTWIALVATGASFGVLPITMLGLFGFYTALTGARLVKLKGNFPATFDKGVVSTGLLISLSMIVLAIWLFIMGYIAPAIIISVLGTLFCVMTIQDFAKYVLNKPIKKDKFGNMEWYFNHFGRMYGSFIAATTAFLAVNNIFRNSLINFLLPTVVGIFLIIITEKKYKKKYNF